MGIRSYFQIKNDSDWSSITERFFRNKNRTTNLKISATGGTISTPGDGYRYHTFTTPGTFSVTSGQGLIEMIAIGAGGGGGGDDGPDGGGGGGGGAAVASFNLSPISLTVAVGGGGGGGTGCVAGTGAGPAGSNGGGTGGNAGTSGCSGGGGGGGGWSGVYAGSTYYIAAGGGAGGGGSNEGPANDIPARGGGSPANTYRTDSSTGTSGLNYPGDGGGYGGCGGGISNATGTAGGGSGNQSQFGGSNFINPIASTSNLYAGGDGAAPANSTAGTRAPGFLPANPSWSPVIPATAGNGGNGATTAPATAPSGQPGIVVIRYPA